MSHPPPPSTLKRTALHFCLDAYDVVLGLAYVSTLRLLGVRQRALPIPLVMVRERPRTTPSGRPAPLRRAA